MWDDGLVTDLKLLDILRKAGATAAFALSPSRHKIVRSTNDNRGDYGTLVSKYELAEFNDFEVVNHTNTHLDLGKINPEMTRTEIIEGRSRLEAMFDRAVKGFCYPYGVHTSAALIILRQERTLYARTTSNGHTQHDNLLLHPTGRWYDVNLEKLGEGTGRLILWGHTYELRNTFDWDHVKAMYAIFTHHPNIKLVTFEEIVRQ